MRTLFFIFLATASLWGQLSPGALTRTSRDGDKLAAFENPQRLSIFSTASGRLELTRELDLGSGIRDFDLDASNAFYFLTQANEIVKWRPQAAGFEARFAAPEGSRALTVDSSGERLFVASDSSIAELRTDGSLANRSSQPLKNIEKLRFDETTGLLYAQGADFIASLDASLQNLTVHSAKGGLLPGASNTNRAAIYPSGFLIEPPAQTVTPGTKVLFYIRTILRNQQVGSMNLTVEAPLPFELGRTVIDTSDATLLSIDVPANQAPGVYRVVARLNNGAAGIASAVFIIPFPGSTLVPMAGTAPTPRVLGLPDAGYKLVSSPDPDCTTATIVDDRAPIGGGLWDFDNNVNFWISGRADAINGCAPGLYRYRHEFDLRAFDPTTANIAVAAWADNAVTVEINGTAIPSEPQELGEPEAFRIPRVYGIPRSALRQGTNSLDFIVRNDPYLSLPRNPTGLKVQILNATAVPVQSPEPPPVGDFTLSLTPAFRFVNGSTAQYTIEVNRLGGFTGTPNFFINLTPPNGYQAVIQGNLLTVTRDPNVTTSQTSWRFAVLGIFNQTTRSVDGAFIQNPFVPVDLPIVSTGVVFPGVPAADGSVDTHYSLSSSADAAFPGPNAVVAEFNRSPFGPWVLNDRFSKWISPRPDPNNLNAPGVYRYRTAFDLGLGDANSAVIALRWAADNDAKVYLNGREVGALFAIDNFRRLNDLLITEGFQQGMNILEFAVNNANLGGSSQTGLRVELLAAQAARNPVRFVQVLRGTTVSGPVLLSNTGFSFTAPAGIAITANSTNLLISASDAAPLGVHTVTVNYNSGGRTSFLVVVGARGSVSYLVNGSGQADEGTVDPNYRIVQSPDLLFPTTDAYVVLSSNSPISLGFWAPNQINSRWISPRRDTLNNNAPGVYRYRTTFDLTGRNLTSAMLALEWACDNRGTVELNGVKVGEIDGAEGFRTLRPLSITSGFRAGINTLDFVVTNDGVPYTVSPTGLHVNILGAFAVSQGTAPGPDFTVSPSPFLRTINAGQTASFEIRVTPNDLFTQPVAFSVVNPPAGFTFSFDPPSARFSTVFNAVANAQIARGTYLITVRARFGDIVRDTVVRVDVDAGARSLTVASTGRGTPGSIDPNYVIVDGLGLPGTAYVARMVDAPPQWSSGPWISTSPDIAINAAGRYRYRTTFDLTGFNPATAEISGSWDADDTAECYLNGTLVATLSKNNLYESGRLFLNSGFRAGVNTLEFVVTNATPSPTGLMVSIQSATAQEQ